jgi:MarR family
VVSWTFLTSHARVLLLVAHDPGVRLRDIAASLNITERSAFSIITDLVQAGYVIKEKDGRRNRYHIQAHLPLPEPTSQERTVGEVLALLTGTGPAATPGPGPDGQRPTAQTRAGRAAGEPRGGGPRRDSPRSAVPGGRKQART